MQYFRMFILTLLCAARFSGYAQSPDSLTASNNNAVERQLPSPHLYRGLHSFAFPLVLVTYGSIAQSSEELKEMDQQIKTMALKQYTYKTHIDNYLQPLKTPRGCSVPMVLGTMPFPRDIRPRLLPEPNYCVRNTDRFHQSMAWRVTLQHPLPVSCGSATTGTGSGT